MQADKIIIKTTSQICNHQSTIEIPKSEVLDGEGFTQEELELVTRVLDKYPCQLCSVSVALNISLYEEQGDHLRRNSPCLEISQ